MKSIFILVLVAAAIAIAVMLFRPISRTKDTPLMRAYGQLHQTCTKLRQYAYDHSTFPDGASTNGSIETLVADGILSSNDAVFIHDNRVTYYGYDLRQTSPDVPVFEMVFTDTKIPRRIIAYSDGHATMSKLETGQ